MHGRGVIGIVHSQPCRKVSGQVDLAAVAQRRARAQYPGPKLRLSVRPSMRLIQDFEPIGGILKVRPSLLGGSGLDLGAVEDLLHGIGKDAKQGTSCMERHDYGMLIAVGVLMFVADNYR